MRFSAGTEKRTVFPSHTGPSVAPLKGPATSSNFQSVVICYCSLTLALHLHPVGIPRFVAASLIEKPSVAQGPIGFHIKHANVATGRVVDIEERLVRREAQAIGVFKVIGNRGQCFSIGRQTKNADEI